MTDVGEMGLHEALCPVHHTTHNGHLGACPECVEEARP